MNHRKIIFFVALVAVVVCALAVFWNIFMHPAQQNQLSGGHPVSYGTLPIVTSSLLTTGSGGAIINNGPRLLPRPLPPPDRVMRLLTKAATMLFFRRIRAAQHRHLYRPTAIRRTKPATQEPLVERCSKYCFFSGVARVDDDNDPACFSGCPRFGDNH